MSEAVFEFLDLNIPEADRCYSNCATEAEIYAEVRETTFRKRLSLDPQRKRLSLDPQTKVILYFRTERCESIK